ncbi:hypothetical protein F511_18515 [Dorcoceras hygrometricum]|uniref:Uncharacterized protein n=1 Tax=Dorcoceras hygrometricum TaxID=472368 RepID=A0A2Z7D5S3_9LAMI|nr:hypothetical protein F511_18515 [Dorcoceras hygrometricum]
MASGTLPHLVTDLVFRSDDLTSTVLSAYITVFCCWLTLLPLLCAKEDAGSCCGLCAATRLFLNFLYCVQRKVEVGVLASLSVRICAPTKAVMTPNGDPRLSGLGWLPSWVGWGCWLVTSVLVVLGCLCVSSRASYCVLPDLLGVGSLC